MASLNVFEPIFFFGIIIFLTHKPISKTNLRYFYVRFFFFCSALNSVLSQIKDNPRINLPSVFYWRWGGGREGGQDTPRYTHLKCKKGYFSNGGIFI